jgi:hypothetical protein
VYTAIICRAAGAGTATTTHSAAPTGAENRAEPLCTERFYLALVLITLPTFGKGALPTVSPAAAPGVADVFVRSAPAFSRTV